MYLYLYVCVCVEEEEDVVNKIDLQVWLPYVCVHIDPTTILIL